MNEAELCTLFADAARLDGWTVYPEVLDWDLVLVWERDDGRPESSSRDPRGSVIRKGDQIAVEAKGRATAAALKQAHKRMMPRGGSSKGPDFKAVLVPSAPDGFTYCAAQMQLTVFDSWNYESSKPSGRRYRHMEPWRRPVLPVFDLRLTDRWNGKMWVPPVVPENVEAGVPSPQGLTPWRVKALRVCHLLRTRGWVTSADFKRIGIDIGRWRNWGSKSWLKDSGRRDGRRHVYELAEPLPSDFPDIGWEVERDAIAAQEAK